jgi:hypothetical protein
MPIQKRFLAIPDAAPAVRRQANVQQETWRRGFVIQEMVVHAADSKGYKEPGEEMRLCPTRNRG